MVSTFTIVAKDVAGKGANPSFVSILFCGWSIARGIASILGPIAASALFDPTATGSDFGRYGFKSITIFVGVMSLLSGLGGIAIGFARRRQNRIRGE